MAEHSESPSLAGESHRTGTNDQQHTPALKAANGDAHRTANDNVTTTAVEGGRIIRAGQEQQAKRSAPAEGEDCEHFDGISYEDVACCEVCTEGDWEEGNAIIFCDSCDLAVHQSCYGAGARNIPEGDEPWYCDLCRAQGKRTSRRADQACVLCPQRGGAMKRTSDGRWAHIACALWIPGADFLDPEGRDVIHLFGINEKRLDLVCSICAEKTGACIQCKAPRCLRAFHVSCARRKGLHMAEKERQSWVEYNAFCDRHRPATASSKKKRRRREIKW